MAEIISWLINLLSLEQAIGADHHFRSVVEKRQPERIVLKPELGTAIVADGGDPGHLLLAMRADVLLHHETVSALRALVHETQKERPALRAFVFLGFLLTHPPDQYQNDTDQEEKNEH